jgi:hypothetical protein
MQLVGLTTRDRTLHPTSPSIKSGGEIIFDRSGKHKWQLRADPSFGASVSDVDRLASRASHPPTDLVRRIAGSYHRPAKGGPRWVFSAAADDRHDDDGRQAMQQENTGRVSWKRNQFSCSQCTDDAASKSSHVTDFSANSTSYESASEVGDSVLTHRTATSRPNNDNVMSYLQLK